MIVHYFMRHTKIISTIGPASNSPAVMKRLLLSGMSVARLNLSHGTHSDHTLLIKNLRQTAKESKKSLAILADIQGPKIRLGNLPKEGIDLKNGQDISFSTTAKTYEKGVFPVTYRYLHRDVSSGDRILIDDGLVEVKATVVRDSVIHAKVTVGGHISSHKGMNFPDTQLSLSSLTKKDRLDVQFAVKQNVDWIALSFAMRPEDVKLLRKLIHESAKKGQTLPKIIVKIEKHEALDNFDEILLETDAVMIARGDLGVEIPVEEVPVWQKELIERTRLAGKPVIVATQMLDSMIRNPRPTRAEASDVANAVFDQADAVMLSGETASGLYPVESIKTMASIIDFAEGSRFLRVPEEMPPDSLHASVSRALQQLAASEHIDGILISPEAFDQVHPLSSMRPQVPLYCAVQNETVERQLLLSWGVQSFVMTKTQSANFLENSFDMLKKSKHIKRGMKLAVLFGGEHGEGFDLITVF